MNKIHEWINTGLILAIGILVLVGGNQSVPSSRLAGSYNCDVDTCFTSLGVTGQTYLTTFTQGGGIRSTSTSGTVVPLLATDFDTENVIDVTLNVQDATLSFPATSSLSSFISTAGETRTLFIRNATTTPTMDLTISGGTGVLLKKATTTPIVYGDSDGANFAKVELTRKANTDIEALLTIYGD